MRYLIILLTFFLVSCESYIHRTENINERLSGFIFDGKKMYVLGSHSDYLFENQDVAAFQQLIKSPFAQHILAVDLNFQGLDNQIFAEYAVYLDPRRYSQSEQEQLQKQFWFNPLSKIKTDVVSKMPNSLNWDSNNPALKRQYRAVGKRVVLKNRAELLAKYAKNTPLAINYQHDFTRQKVSEEVRELLVLTVSAPIWVAQSVMVLALIPVFLPIVVFDLSDK